MDENSSDEFSSLAWLHVAEGKEEDLRSKKASEKTPFEKLKYGQSEK